MPDDLFADPMMAALYDPMEGDRDDLDVYARIADELGAGSVLDVGCGTGVLALMLAERGLDVTGLDPAAASLEIARGKPGADRVRWICGDATALPPASSPALRVDLAVMTGNVAQAIIGPTDWNATLAHVRAVLRPGGHLVFETRDPARRAWESWNRESSYRVVQLPGLGAVTSWVDLLDVDGPLVTFRWTYVREADGGRELTSLSTLRFRERAEIEADLAANGYEVRDVRDAPDRPGREFVFVARTPEVTDPGLTRRDWTAPAQEGPDRIGQAQSGSAQTGSAQTGPDRIGEDRPTPDRTGRRQMSRSR